MNDKHPKRPVFSPNEQRCPKKIGLLWDGGDLDIGGELGWADIQRLFQYAEDTLRLYDSSAVQMTILWQKPYKVRMFQVRRSRTYPGKLLWFQESCDPLGALASAMFHPIEEEV